MGLKIDKQCKVVETFAEIKILLKIKKINFFELFINRFQYGIPNKICLQDYFSCFAKILGTDTLKSAIQNLLTPSSKT